MKRLFLIPAAALAALAASADQSQANTDEKQPITSEGIAGDQLRDALGRAVSLYAEEGQLFGFTLDRTPDGVLVADHYSHYSHSSHVSHSSHRSHYSSTW